VPERDDTAEKIIEAVRIIGDIEGIGMKDKPATSLDEIIWMVVIVVAVVLGLAKLFGAAW
jgi:hypothetical protein